MLIISSPEGTIDYKNKVSSIVPKHLTYNNDPSICIKDSVVNISSSILFCPNGVNKVVFDNCIISINSNVFFLAPTVHIEFSNCKITSNARLWKTDLKIYAERIGFNNSHSTTGSIILSVNTLIIKDNFIPFLFKKYAKSLIMEGIDINEVKKYQSSFYQSAYKNVKLSLRKCDIKIDEDILVYLRSFEDVTFNECNIKSVPLKRLRNYISPYKMGYPPNNILRSIVFQDCTFYDTLDWLLFIKGLNSILFQKSDFSNISYIPYINATHIQFFYCEGNPSFIDKHLIYKKKRYLYMKIEDSFEDITFSPTYFRDIHTHLAVTSTRQSKSIISEPIDTSATFLLVNRWVDISKFDFGNSPLVYIDNYSNSYESEDIAHHYYHNDIEYIYCDRIWAKVLSKKGNVYSIQPLWETDSYSEYFYKYSPTKGKHFQSIVDLRSYLKRINKNNDYLKKYTLESQIPRDKAIQLYKDITTACNIGVDIFLSKNPMIEDKTHFTLLEIVSLTRGEYGHTAFKEAVSHKYNITID